MDDDVDASELGGGPRRKRKMYFRYMHTYEERNLRVAIQDYLCLTRVKSKNRLRVVMPQLLATWPAIMYIPYACPCA